MAERESSSPFRLTAVTSPAFLAIALLGWLLALIAVLVSATALASAQAAFFSFPLAIRQAAPAGSPVIQANISRHVLETWVPQVTYLGLGLGLLAIVMALAAVDRHLRRTGEVMTRDLPPALRPTPPPVPKTALASQILALLGVLILAGLLVYGAVLATSVVPAYYSHSPAEQSAAAPGSALLAQQATLDTFNAYLAPLRLLATGLLALGIILALVVIVGTQRWQADTLNRLRRQIVR